MSAYKYSASSKLQFFTKLSKETKFSAGPEEELATVGLEVTLCFYGWGGADPVAVDAILPNQPPM